MALLIKHDSLRAALGSGTALVASTLKINYNSEQESAAEAPPVVETAARQMALSQTVIQSRLIPKEKLIFNRRMCILRRRCFRMWHLEASDKFNRSCIVRVHISISSPAPLSAFMSLCL